MYGMNYPFKRTNYLDEQFELKQFVISFGQEIELLNNA